MPLSHHGYTSLGLVHVFRARTPLDALYHRMVEVRKGELNVCKWVEQVNERLEMLRKAAALGVAKAKDGSVKRYNKNSKLRKFEVGERVLCRVPGLSN